MVPEHFHRLPGQIFDSFKLLLALLEEAQCDAWETVGLCQHRGSGLCQDVVLSELCALSSEVHIGEAAMGSLYVGVVHAQHV